MYLYPCFSKRNTWKKILLADRNYEITHTVASRWMYHTSRVVFNSIVTGVSRCKLAKCQVSMLLHIMQKTKKKKRKTFLSVLKYFREHAYLISVSRHLKHSACISNSRLFLGLDRTFQSFWHCKFYTVDLISPTESRVRLSRPLQTCNIDVFMVSRVHHWRGSCTSLSARNETP